MPLTPLAVFKGAGLLDQSGRGRVRRFNMTPSVTYLAGTVVGEVQTTVWTVTLGTQGSGTFTLTLRGQAITATAYNATAATLQTNLRALTNLALTTAVQTLHATTSPTGGTYKLSFRGQQTTPLAYNATTTQIQNALVALSSIGTGNMTVSGGAFSAGDVVFTFGGSMAGQPIPDPIEVDLTFLTGAAGVSLYVASVGAGSQATNIAVSGSAGGPYTVTFSGDLAVEQTVMTADFSSLGTPANASLTAPTNSFPVIKASASNATDGSQYPVGVMQFDTTTDSNGLAFWGQSTTSPNFADRGKQSVPVFVSGQFESKDLLGVVLAFVLAPQGTGGPFRLMNGTIGDGLLELPGP